MDRLIRNPLPLDSGTIENGFVHSQNLLTQNIGASRLAINIGKRVIQVFKSFSEKLICIEKVQDGFQSVDSNVFIQGNLKTVKS